mgnify:CR=1 FL=1
MPILLYGLIWIVGTAILVSGGLGQRHPLPGQRPFAATISANAGTGTASAIGAVGEQWVAYRQAVNHYTESHKGTVAPTPCWSQTQLNLNAPLENGWGCQVITGVPETVWVYGLVPPGAASVAAALIDNPVNVGLNQGGVLVPPDAPNDGIKVPISILLGDLVSVDQIR